MNNTINHPSYNPSTGSTKQLVSEAINYSKMRDTIVHMEFDSTAYSMLWEECEDCVKGNDEHEFWGKDIDGVEWRVHMAFDCGKVVIEIMPEYLKASHRAAGNWGVYPHNGAKRFSCDWELAYELEDEDEYAFIVSDAKPEDYPEYPTN